MGRDKQKIKICTKCGKQKPATIEFFHASSHVDGFNKWCKTCKNKHDNLKWGQDKKEKDCARMSKSHYSFLKHWCVDAKRKRSKKGIEFKEGFNLEHLDYLWKKQKGRCALSGIKMTYIKGQNIVLTNVSPDRIDSNKHYEVGNVQLVCHTYNSMKSSYTMKEFNKHIRNLFLYQLKKIVIGFFNV